MTNKGLYKSDEIHSELKSFEVMINKINNVNAGIFHTGSEIIVSSRLVKGRNVFKHLHELKSFICSRNSEVFQTPEASLIFHKDVYGYRTTPEG